MAAQFDVAALTHFWEDAAAMSLTAHTCEQLVLEGIDFPVDLDEFHEKRVGQDLQEPHKPSQSGQWWCRSKRTTL